MFLLLTLCSHVWAVDRAVGDSQPYRTITDALLDSSRGDRVLLDSGVYTEDLTLTGFVGVEVVGNSAPGEPPPVLQGPVGNPNVIWLRSSQIVFRDLVIDGQGARRGVRVASDSRVTLDGVVLEGGFDSDDGHGAALRVATGAEATVQRSLITDNDAQGLGSVYVLGLLTAADSRFVDNLADRGGALYCASGSVCTLTDNEFVGNAATEGGAIYAGGASLTVLRGGFCGNSTFVGGNTGHGGAVYLGNSMSTIQNALFYDNDAEARAGGFYVVGAAPRWSRIPLSRTRPTSVARCSFTACWVRLRSPTTWSPETLVLD